MEGWLAEYVDSVFKCWCRSLSVVCIGTGCVFVYAGILSIWDTLVLITMLGSLPLFYSLSIKSSRLTASCKSTLSIATVEVLEIISLIKILSNFEMAQYGLLYINLLFIAFQLPYLITVRSCIIGVLKHLGYIIAISHSHPSSLNSLNISLIISLTIILQIFYKYVELFQSNYELRKKELARNHVGDIMDGVSEGILLLNRRYEVIFLNQTLKSILKCSESDAISMIATITYEGTGRVIEDIDNYFESKVKELKTIGPVEYRGKYLSFKCSKIVLEVSDALMLVVRDVTEHVELEKCLNKEKSDAYMFRSVAHELRTPTNSIIFFSEKNMQEVEKSSRLYEHLRIVYNNSHYLLNIVNDILDFNRIKSGNFRIIKQDFSPKALLEDSIKLFEFQAQRKNLSISLMMDPLIPSVGYSDPNRIQQILLNLLSNAVK
jgi:signal transduction histidine kinase